MPKIKTVRKSILFKFQYEYQYEVKDPEKQLFFDKNEVGDGTGKVSFGELLNLILIN